MGSVPSQKMSVSSQRGVFSKIQEIESIRVHEAFEAARNGRNHGSSVPTTPIPRSYTFDSALAPQNSDRNRYTNVFPWDATRVHLPVINNQGSDYINASHIRLSTHKYIAAQGPLKNTTHHFWWMCFNESEAQGNDTIVIAMVTPLQESGVTKCFQYWPEAAGEMFDLGPALHKDQYISDSDVSFTVEYVSQEFDQEGDFLKTELKLKFGTKEKTVIHFYYYKWADCRVPPSIEPLIVLSSQIKEIQNLNPKYPPIPIVHCSAGVGRTGTFIILDFLNDQIDKEKFDYSNETIHNLVSTLREQRMMMVQTIHQFNYLYKATDYLTGK